MEKLNSVTAVALPLPIDNCDTDQIMPKQFLRGIDKSGLSKGCFFNMKCHADGTACADSIFNRPGFEGAQIMVAGSNFGCGSSREHAVWGMMQMGFRAVIAPSFGEIFYSNCFNNGLLAAKVTPENAREIYASISDTTPTTLTIDVKAGTITDGKQTWSFTLGERHRTMLLEGLDMVGTTLLDLPAISAFKTEHEKKFPWMAGLPAKAKAVLEKESV